MTKKIFDILPPQEMGDQENINEDKDVKNEKVEEVFVDVKKKNIDPREEDYELLEEGPSFNPGKILPFLGIIALISLGVFGYFALAKALIVIYPVTESSSLETNMTIDQGVSSRSSSAIPGKIYTSEKTLSQEFSSSGTVMKEKKAEGVIRIYNAYSTSPQSLVVNTRFISTEGKLFRITSAVTVPGGHYENQELIPGFVDAEVIADQSGEDFNIKASTFSIPGFAGTPRYTYFYGKSFESMTGGFKDEVAQVVQEDLDDAENIMKQKIEAECLTDLKNKIASESNLIILDKAIQTSVNDISFSVTAKEEADKFTANITAQSTALVFNSQDEKDFIVNFVSSEAPEGKELNQNSIKIERSVDSVDLDSGKIILSLNIDSDFYSIIDFSSLRQALSNKSLDEAKICLEGYDEIERSSVSLWPFWVKKVPENQDKINIELSLD